MNDDRIRALDRIYNSGQGKRPWHMTAAARKPWWWRLLTKLFGTW